MADLHIDAIDYKKVFKDREKRLQLINKLSFIPTVPYLKLVYRIKTGRRLNLKNPQLFSEKINWLKIHNVHPEYTDYVDKYKMKHIISEKFGEEYVFKCFGVWNSFEDIDFSELPKQFVLKCTHDSGSIKIVLDKDAIDYDEFKSFFNNRLKINSYNIGREYPYQNVPPRIIAEEYYETNDGNIITDYRFFCFSGHVKLFYVMSGRNKDEKETWFDRDCNRLDIIDKTTLKTDKTVQLPQEIKEMLQFAEEISSELQFARIDLYEDNGKFYFGEVTFFPYGGFMLLEPIEWEYKLGEWLAI